LKDQKFVTDAEGQFSVTFAEPGMYWMNATIGGPRAGGPGAVPGAGAGGPRGMMPAGDRANYVATLEVLPQ
jgi:hypothetical protein